MSGNQSKSHCVCAVMIGFDDTVVFSTFNLSSRDNIVLIGIDCCYIVNIVLIALYSYNTCLRDICLKKSDDAKVMTVSLENWNFIFNTKCSRKKQFEIISKSK